MHWAPGIPRALLFSRDVFLAQLGRYLRRGDAESRSPIVMPRFMRGIQYAVTSRVITAVSGILDRPVRPGDDNRVSCLTIKSELPRQCEQSQTRHPARVRAYRPEKGPQHIAGMDFLALPSGIEPLSPP